ncbi:MAG: hypothetical protein JW936_11870 [Sedimentisphaerales bacterium]|nr:hypothetical protein [Sedimentisphaerales bacterium]
MIKNGIILFMLAVALSGSMAFGVVGVADIDDSNNVDLNDFAMMAENYLQCTDVANIDCAEYWGYISIGLVMGDYEEAGYEPNTLWEDLGTYLNAGRVSDLRVDNIATWANQLDDYNILIFTNLYDYDMSVNVAAYASQISSWLQSHRTIIIIEGAGMSGIDWLDDVNAAWTLSANDRVAGLPDWVDPDIIQLHDLPDGWPANGFYTGRIPNPNVADFANGGLNVPAAGTVLVKNRNDRPTVWSDSMGAGNVIVTSYFNGYGLDELVIENFVKYCWDTYEGNIAEPCTIAEQVAQIDLISETAPFEVSFNSDDVMLVDGSPYFPWGFYSLTRSSSLTLMDTNGFNFANNWHNSLPSYPSISVQREITWANWEIRDEMISNVELTPIVSWELLQEPSNVDPQLDNYWVKYRAELSHRLDPARPVSVLCNSPAIFDIYGPLTDFAVVDPYCVTSSASSLDRIARDITDMQSVTGKPVWALLQATGDTSIGYTLPTAAQLKAEMYTALASDAKGIFWYVLEGSDSNITYLRPTTTTYTEPQWSTLLSLSTEFTAIEPYITAQSLDVSVVSPAQGVYARRWTKTAAPQHLLVIVNSRASAASVTIDWPLATTNYTALFGSPALSFPTGQISVSLGGYGVGVYTFTE